MAVQWSYGRGKTGSIWQQLTRSTAVVQIENQNFFFLTTTVHTTYDNSFAVLSMRRRVRANRI